MESIEKYGKTEEEAINSALVALGVPREDVTTTVLEIGAKGFIGIGAKPYKVLVSVNYNPERAAKTFLKEVTLAMGLTVTIETKMEDKQLYANVKGEDMGILIGKRGQTLDSLQYLLNLVVNKGDSTYLSVTLDTENYRQRRKETLESLAINLAKKAKATHKRVVLEPMNPYERRIIHSILQPDRAIETKSEGTEPFRYIVITAK